MRVRRRKVIGQIIHEPAGCPSCHWPDQSYLIRVENLTASTKTRRLSGSGQVWTLCPSCRARYTAVRKQIPVLCQEINCPSCDSQRPLVVDLTEITIMGTEFQFEAVLQCPDCGRERLFRRILRNLGRIKKVRVGPAEIELEQS